MTVSVNIILFRFRKKNSPDTGMPLITAQFSSTFYDPSEKHLYIGNYEHVRSMVIKHVLNVMKMTCGSTVLKMMDVRKHHEQVNLFLQSSSDFSAYTYHWILRGMYRT
jgi:hypothetical protein